MPPKRSHDRYMIRDKELFRKLIRRLRSTHGSGVKAAKAIGISQAGFSRVEHTKAGETITHDVMDKLSRALIQLAPRLKHDLARCVMGTAGKKLWHEIYLPWCRERAERVQQRRGPHWLRNLGAEASGRKKVYKSGRQWHVPNRASLLRTTQIHMKADCPDLWSSGVARLRATGASGGRLKVSLTRIAEPLAEFADSGYIERRWGELSKPEQRRYLGIAFELELLVLARPHDQDRAREVAESVEVTW